MLPESDGRNVDAILHDCPLRLPAEEPFRLRSFPGAL